MEAIRPKQSITEIATGFLDEGQLKAFVDFYSFLTNHKLAKAKTSNKSFSWAISYKHKKIGHFGFRGSLWSIDCFDLFSRNAWFEKCEKNLTVELKDFILANINTTSSCCVKGVCHSVEKPVILGKMFLSRVCACRPIVFINPDGKTLEYAKELLLIGKNIVAEMAETA